MHPSDHPGIPTTPARPASPDVAAELARMGILAGEGRDALDPLREVLRTWDQVTHLRANEQLLALSPVIQAAKRSLLLTDLRPGAPGLGATVPRHAYTLHPAVLQTPGEWREEPKVECATLTEAYATRKTLEDQGRCVEIQRDDGLWLASNGRWEPA